MTALLVVAFSMCVRADVTVADVTIEPQIATWLEVDTNAPRVSDKPIEEETDVDEDEGDDFELVPPDPFAPRPQRPTPDGLVRSELLLSASVRAPGLVLRSDSALGVKLFFTQRNERMIVGQTRATLSTSNAPGGTVLTLSTFAKGRAQVSGARTYGLLRTDGIVDKAFLDWLTVRVGASGHAFQAFDADDDEDGDEVDEDDEEDGAATDGVFSFAGASAVAGARTTLGPAESLDLLVDVGGRGFPFAPQDVSQARDDPDRRADAVLTGILQITSARRLYLSGSYLITRNASNARGESYTRHRLTGIVGIRLPAQITCTAQGAIQITSYDDGVSVGQAYFLGNDEESQNVLDVTLSRHLWNGFYVEAHAAFYGNELAVEGARFSRQTAALGIRAVL